MTILLIISLLFNVGIVIGFVSLNVISKMEKLEETIENQQTTIENQQAYINALSGVIEEADKKFEESNVKEAFKADDQIGWFFKDLLYIKDLLNKFKISNNGKETQTKNN